MPDRNKYYLLKYKIELVVGAEYFTLHSVDYIQT